MITLKQLRYFSALARHRHFGRAASDCAVTQPALSMQIRELEREIGVDLVERRPADVTLTAAGREVVERADTILTATRDLIDFARHRGRPLTGSLHLGVIPTVAPYVLPRVLPSLQAEYPDLKLDVRETQTRVLLEELARGQLDAVMLALADDTDEFDTLPLFDDRFLLAIAANDPVMPKSPVAPQNVDHARLILLEEGHCLRDQALAFCSVSRGAAGNSAAASFGASSLATVVQMVANGYGITLLPEVAIGVELRDERVKVLRFRDPQPLRTIGLAWRRTSPRAADFRALGRIVTETLGAAAQRKTKIRP